MKVLSTDEFEKKWNELSNKQRASEKQLIKRREFVTKILENLKYREALNTTYFEKCENSKIVHSVIVWKKGILNTRIVCAIYENGEICVYLDVFLEKRKEDYRKAISNAEIYAKRLAIEENLTLWDGE